MDFEFFYGYDHPLSQWYRSSFVINGIEYNTAEQWMMYSKAVLFDDIVKSKEILNEYNPLHQRKLGRMVKGFNKDVWDQNKESIVYQGNLEKFNQDKLLRQFLLGTANKILAEASPTDLVWGIGYNINDERRFIVDKWRGKNLLGIILMKIRTILLDDSSYIK